MCWQLPSGSSSSSQAIRSMYTSPAPLLWNSTTRTCSDQGERDGTFLNSPLGCAAWLIVALPGPFPFAFRLLSRGAKGHPHSRTLESWLVLIVGPYRIGQRGRAKGNSAAPSRVTTGGSGTGLSTIRHLSGGRVALFPFAFFNVLIVPNGMERQTIS